MTVIVENLLIIIGKLMKNNGDDIVWMTVFQVECTEDECNMNDKVDLSFSYFLAFFSIF